MACNFVTYDDKIVAIPLEKAMITVEYLKTAADVVETNGDRNVKTEFDEDTLKKVAEYVMATEPYTLSIPEPLPGKLQNYVKTWEFSYLEALEKDKLAVAVLNAAYFLQINTLRDLISAYFAQRIDEISRAAPSIMEGAAQLREYFNLPDEWTAEEKEHLRKEMEYIKSVDPSAY